MRKMAMSICLGTAILFMASMTVPNLSIGFSHDSIIGAAKKQYKKAAKKAKKARKTYKKAKKTVIKKGKRFQRRKKRFAKKLGRKSVERKCAKKFRRNRKKMNDCRVRGMKGLPGFGAFEPAKRNLRKMKSPGQLKRCTPNPAKISSVNKCSNQGLLSTGSSVRINSVVRRKKSGQRGIWCKVTVLNAASQSQVSNGARGWVRRNKIRNPNPKGC